MATASAIKVSRDDSSWERSNTARARALRVASSRTLAFGKRCSMACARAPRQSSPAWVAGFGRMTALLNATPPSTAPQCRAAATMPGTAGPYSR